MNGTWSCKKGDLTRPGLLLIESHRARARGQRLYSYSSGHDVSLSYFVEAARSPELGQSIDSGGLIGNAREAAGHKFDNGYYSRRLIAR